MTFHRGVTGGLSLGDVTSYFFLLDCRAKRPEGQTSVSQVTGASQRIGLVETWSAHGQVWDQALSSWMSSVLLLLLLQARCIMAPQTRL